MLRLRAMKRDRTKAFTPKWNICNFLPSFHLRFRIKCDGKVRTAHKQLFLVQFSLSCRIFRFSLHSEIVSFSSEFFIFLSTLVLFALYLSVCSFQCKVFKLYYYFCFIIYGKINVGSVGKSQFCYFVVCVFLLLLLRIVFLRERNGE